MAKDYYETLGVSKNANKEEIKRAYKKLAMQYHPDRNKEKGAEEKFKEISEAYAVLTDDTKREQYNQFGSEGFQQRYSHDDIFRGVDINDIFGDIFDGSIFEGFFGGGRKRRSRGNDLMYELEIEFEEAYTGVAKEIEFSKLNECEKCNGIGSEDGKYSVCSQCEGTGQMRIIRRTPFGNMQQVSTCNVCKGEGKKISNECKECRGSGRTKQKRKLKINIPAGVNTGNRLKVSNEGELGVRGSSAGDLYVVIKVNESEIFEREENDIYLNLPLSFSQAALGDEIKIPTLDGEVTLKIPSGTQSEAKFKIKNKGFPSLDGYGNGDEYIMIQIVTPKNLSKEQKKLFTDLKKTETKKSILDKIKEFAKG